MISLIVERRTNEKSANAVRFNGLVPAVFYGPKEESTSVAIKEVDFLKVWKKAGESSVIVLKDGDKEHEALIHDVQIHPVTQKVLHVDFYVIEKGKKVEVNVPLEFEGVSPAVKDLGGTLMKVMHEIHIEAKPADLPHEIKVDISSLVDFQSKIHAKDLKLPNGVDLKSDPEEVVALVSEAKKEEEEKPAEPVDLSQIEISEERGKKEEEETAPEAKE